MAAVRVLTCTREGGKPDGRLSTMMATGVGQ
jgi:hypothetical protein